MNQHDDRAAARASVAFDARGKITMLLPCDANSYRNGDQVSFLFLQRYYA